MNKIKDVVFSSIIVSNESIFKQMAPFYVSAELHFQYPLVNFLFFYKPNLI